MRVSSGKAVTALMVAIGLLVTPLMARADEGELLVTQQAIGDVGAQWSAGETSVSALDDEQKANLVGTLPPKVEPVVPARAGSPATSLPTQVDWTPYVSAVRDQGSCGSCWSFASVAALESLQLMAMQSPYMDLDLSEQTLIGCSGAGNCGGGYIEDAADYLVESGTATESCSPYQAANSGCSVCADWPTRNFGMSSWQWITDSSASVDQIKAGLQNGPLVSTIVVFNDLYYYTGGIYAFTNSRVVGLHAILIVGYDDASQCFTVKNSWGADWGERGFFRIAYSEVGGLTQFGRYSIQYAGARQPDCVAKVSASSTHFSSKAGTVRVYVELAGGCDWTTSSDTSGVTPKKRLKGPMYGSGYVDYKVPANRDYSYRSILIRAGGSGVVITQDGKPSRRR